LGGALLWPVAYLGLRPKNTVVAPRVADLKKNLQETLSAGRAVAYMTMREFGIASQRSGANPDLGHKHRTSDGVGGVSFHQP
jgi:hypothetical protein